MRTRPDRPDAVAVETRVRSKKEKEREGQRQKQRERERHQAVIPFDQETEAFIQLIPEIVRLVVPNAGAMTLQHFTVQTAIRAAVSFLCTRSACLSVSVQRFGRLTATLAQPRRYTATVSCAICNRCNGHSSVNATGIGLDRCKDRETGLKRICRICSAARSFRRVSEREREREKERIYNCPGSRSRSRSSHVWPRSDRRSGPEFFLQTRAIARESSPPLRCCL